MDIPQAQFCTGCSCPWGCGKPLRFPQLQLMDKVVVLTLVVQDRGYGPDSAAVEIPQVQFLDEVDMLVVVQRQVPGCRNLFGGKTVQKTVEFPQLQCLVCGDKFPEFPGGASDQFIDVSWSGSEEGYEALYYAIFRTPSAWT